MPERDPIGTDIHLSWNTMTDLERRAQITGWSIRHGHVGYLRASIDMEVEHVILRHLFPQVYWDTPEDDGLPYDFRANNERMTAILDLYRRGRVMGTDPLFAPRRAAAAQLEAMLTAQYGGTFQHGGTLSTTERGWWAKSLRDFYALGTQRQDEARDPRVWISW